jgi:hypothetical protein
MNAPQGHAAPESGSFDDILSFDKLVADPEIAALLDFEPVPRKTSQVNGWTPEAQRDFIARLAVHGSIGKASSEVSKDRSGATKLYNSPEGAGFRAAWHAAIDLAKRRRALAIAARPPAGSKPPTIDNRRKAFFARQPEPQPEPTMSEDEKLELVERIAQKFMRKVVQEREARLNGEIVAADFYLRQITAIEVMFDLAARHSGVDPQAFLSELRRGEHGLLDIASTEFSDRLDRSRRIWWAEEGEPDRPAHPDPRFLTYRRSSEGDYATDKEMDPGPFAEPPPGVGEEEWANLDGQERERLVAEAQERLAAEQRDHERAAHEAWKTRHNRGWGPTEEKDPDP